MIRMNGTWPSGPGIVVANHVSHLDGLILAAVLPEPILFGVDPDFATRQPWKAGLWLACQVTGSEIVPLSSERPLGVRALVKALKNGQKIGIFPEGRINRTEEPLLPLQPGAARLAILCGVPIIPVRILGMKEWIFSTAPAERKRLVPRVAIEIGEAICPDGSLDKMMERMADSLPRAD